ncbi:hypothetical protein SAMN05421692_3444 [Chryseobacterium indologenes]|nr:hypothetical protein SAMN05421692_3444 [Chryseobacterium indologenes]SUX51388.1 Uncharacterised protein [Chryseobacterium indologenes]
MPNNNLYNAMHIFYFHHQKEKKDQRRQKNQEAVIKDQSRNKGYFKIINTSEYMLSLK